MASSFPLFVAQGAEHTVVRNYTPDATNVFVPGSLVYYETTGNTMDVCGADPALVAGISEVSSVANALITPDGKVPVRIFTHAGVVLGGASATTPAVSYIGDQVGFTLSGTTWLVDVAKTTTTSRATVLDVDIANGIFFVLLHSHVAAGTPFLQFGEREVAQS